MKKIIVGFGDSWTYGSELDLPRERPWVEIVAEMMNADFINLGTPASSIGYTVVKLFEYINSNMNQDLEPVFMIGLTGTSRYLSYNNIYNEFATIHPDCVYRTTFNKNGAPPDVIDCMKEMHDQTYKYVDDLVYRKFLLNQTLMLFQNHCKLNDINLLCFSYFDYLAPDIDVNMYPVTITKALTGNEYILPDIRNNQYFAGKLFHPNQAGHVRIAELLKEYYDQKYPGN
jgi:hypothetical protein